VPSPSLFHGKPGLVIGSGGAARSAVYALRRMMECKPVYIVNRFAHEAQAVIDECLSKGFGQNLVHVETVEQARALAAGPPAAVVSCVPDFPPRTEEEVRARRVVEWFLGAGEEKGAFLEMCYHPHPITELGTVAEGLGWQVILGTEAMIYQGLEQVS
jgi:quinate dehydrogenase